MIISEKHLRKLIRNMIIENDTEFDYVYQQVVDSNKETEENKRKKNKKRRKYQPTSKLGLDSLISLDNKESQNNN
jgi:hypothetical protein